MSLLPVRKRLLLLGLLGVLMTLCVAGAALVSLAQVSNINHELAQVNRAQRYHQDADMMHDALRADVARAELAGFGRPGILAAEVREETDRHAAHFRRDLRAAGRLSLPPRLRTALDRLRPAQLTYITTAESMVDAALTNRGTAPAAQASYEAAFQQLVPAQAQVTDQLVSASARIERAAIAEKNEAERMIGIATLAALAGWLALVAWHNHSMGSLQGALVREAEQRSAADLLQRSLLPTHLPEVPGVRLAARSVPGSSRQRVGGDWYDVIALPTGQVCLVVGDVVGHDLPAATVMGQLRNTLRAYVLEDPSPASVLHRVNRAAHLLNVSDLATCICAVFDPSTMKVQWSSAGHLPPLVSYAAGAGTLLSDEPGPPLGVTPMAEYQHHETQLKPGDNLLLFSDGLVERRGTSIDAGLTALQTASLSHVDARAVCDQLLATLLDGGANRDDDVTLLLLQVEGLHSVGSEPASPAAAPQPVRTAVVTAPGATMTSSTA